MPDFTLESALGHRVAGVDEVGRGPLAGPVVAAAVIFPTGVPAALAALVDDSKRLSVAARENAFMALRASDALIGVGAASVTEIEHINILQASFLAMRRALLRLPCQPDAVLVDGNKPPALPFATPCPVQCVVGGDGKSLSIAAASIIAKVIRDRAMQRLHQRWPHYGWDRNAGYGTVAHRHGLREYGISPHHRAAFGLVRQLKSYSSVDVTTNDPSA